MTSRTHDLESYIHDGTLKDLIAAHLYATCLVPDNEEVLEITLSLPNKHNIRTIRYKTIKHKEVDLIVHS